MLLYPCSYVFQLIFNFLHLLLEFLECFIEGVLTEITCIVEGIAKGFGELAAFMRHDELCIIPAALPEFYKLLRQILPNLVDCVAVHLYEGLGKPDDIAAGERFYNSTNVALDRNECIDNCFCHRYCCCPDRVKNPYGYSAPNRKGIKYPS